jgi:lipopolysaccharide export system protein LptA
MGGIESRAQSIAAHDSNAPVDYAANRIELQDRQNRIVLSGNVVIEQAGLTLRAARTLVSYDDAGELTIDSITATGGVTIARGSERARGSSAIYDFDRRIITMAGNVELRRGGDTLRGGRLVIDLARGLASVDGSGASSSSAPAASNRPSGTFRAPELD